MTKQAMMNDHPVLVVVGSIYGITNAFLAMIVAFEVVSWTEAQVGLVLAFVNAMLAPVSALVAQRHTTPYDPAVDNRAARLRLDG